MRLNWRVKHLYGSLCMSPDVFIPVPAYEGRRRAKKRQQAFQEETGEASELRDGDEMGIRHNSRLVSLWAIVVQRNLGWLRDGCYYYQNRQLTLPLFSPFVSTLFSLFTSITSQREHPVGWVTMECVFTACVCLTVTNWRKWRWTVKWPLKTACVLPKHSQHNTHSAPSTLSLPRFPTLH